jgi:hypothetical protein
MLRLFWHLLTYDEVFIDDVPRSKQVRDQKLPKKIQSLGFNTFIELLSKASEVIIMDKSHEVVRLELSD